MPLIDEAIIRVQSGAGGNGCISFRREKYVPHGGPNGGNGGDGGSVFIRATRDRTSLLDFKFKPKFEAPRGEHGKGKDMYGRGGEDLTLRVPVGTLVYDASTGELICDLDRDGKEILVARGGKGGRGNMHFATSTNRAPRIATPGEAGEARELKFELRLIADVGLVGLPNAGKSSFLRTVSRAQPKVADYPFTTLEPHLGMVEHKSQTFVVADLPGLIEGASQGSGLGHKFLRHVSRNRLLLHLVDVTGSVEEVKQQVEVIQRELEAYDTALLKRERLLVFTKVDLLSSEQQQAKRGELHEAGLDGFFISSHTGQGVGELLDVLATRAQAWKKLEDERDRPPVSETATPESSDSGSGGHWSQAELRE